MVKVEVSVATLQILASEGDDDAAYLLEIGETMPVRYFREADGGIVATDLEGQRVS